MDVEASLDRLLSTERIRQLVSRYAVALDGRDIDAMAALFVEDVRTADGGHGREALARWLDGVMRPFTVTFHPVGTHVIDFQDADHATGTVYCRPEHKVGHEWIVMPLQYWDRYERQGGEWYFRSRSPHAYYAAPLGGNPDAAEGRFHFPGNPLITTADLPERLASWQAFWAIGED